MSKTGIDNAKLQWLQQLYDQRKDQDGKLKVTIIPPPLSFVEKTGAIISRPNDKEKIQVEFLSLGGGINKYPTDLNQIEIQDNYTIVVKI